MIHWNPAGIHRPRLWFNRTTMSWITPDKEQMARVRWNQHTLRIHLVLCSIEIKWWSGKHKVPW